MRLVFACAISVLGYTTIVGSASARCAPAYPVRVGPTTGNPEKDTVGLVCATQEQALPARWSTNAPPVQVGRDTGHGEQDTIGYVYRRD
jgi:hypothetical protein